MNYTKEFKRKVFDKTAGRCHLCGGGLFFNNFGTLGKRGAWEFEHSNLRSKGGTDHLNNLMPAHIDCNNSKSNPFYYAYVVKYFFHYSQVMLV